MHEILSELLQVAQSLPKEDWTDVAGLLEKYYVEAQLFESMFRNFSQVAAKVDSLDYLIAQINGLDQVTMKEKVALAIGDVSKPNALITWF